MSDMEKTEKLECYCMCFFGKSGKSMFVFCISFFFLHWYFGREIPGFVFFLQNSL